MPTTTTLEINTVSAQDEIAQRVINDMLPVLEKAFTDLKAIQEIWLINGINDKIAAAVTAEETLAGFSPQDWTCWGTAFAEMIIALDQPIASIGNKTIRQVLITRYQKAPTT